MALCKFCTASLGTCTWKIAHMRNSWDDNATPTANAVQEITESSKSPISRSSAALDHKHRNNYNAIINYRSKLEEPNTTSGCYNRPYKHYCTITLGFHPFHPWQWHMFCLLGGRYKQKVRAYPPHVRRYWWKYSKHILYTTPQIRVIRSLFSIFSIPGVEYQHPR